MVDVASRPQQSSPLAASTRAAYDEQSPDEAYHLNYLCMIVTSVVYRMRLGVFALNLHAERRLISIDYKHFPYPAELNSALPPIVLS